MEHLMGCHGEWALILGSLANLPVIGILVRNRITRCLGKDDV